MALQFEEVNRAGVPQKIGMMGPAGAGKTESSLRIAIGMASATDKVFMIDTENERGRSYDFLNKKDGKKFRHLGLHEPFSPEMYLEAFLLAVEKGAEVVVIDSLSHVWEAEGGVLNKKEMMDAKDSRNTFANWSAAKRPLGKLIRAVLNSDVDVIITIRSKIDYTQRFDDVKKKMVVETHGLQPVMQPGFEYELMTLLYIGDNHVPDVRKDLTRTLYSIMEPIDYKHGEAIRAWKEGGSPVEKEEPPVLADKRVISYLYKITEYLGIDWKCPQWLTQEDGKILYDMWNPQYNQALKDAAEAEQARLAAEEKDTPPADDLP